MRSVLGKYWSSSFFAGEVHKLAKKNETNISSIWNDQATSIKDFVFFVFLLWLYFERGGGGETRPGTEKRCSHSLQSDPLGSGFKKGRKNFPQ